MKRNISILYFQVFGWMEDTLMDRTIGQRRISFTCTLKPSRDSMSGEETSWGISEAGMLQEPPDYKISFFQLLKISYEILQLLLRLYKAKTFTRKRSRNFPGLHACK